jgi:exopolysaccharide biosynthesis polyprenyl glycosylphosphotransferase
VLCLVSRASYRNWLGSRRRDGAYLRRVLLVGCGVESEGLTALLDCHPELGYEPVGVLGDAATAQVFDQAWCGDLDDLKTAMTATAATGAIVCVTALDSPTLNYVVQELLESRAHVQLSSGLRGVQVQRLRPLPLAHEPLFYVEPVSLARWQLTLKRALDLAVASVVLLAAAPIIALAAAAIYAEDRGPMFFRQIRVGRDGRQFALYKLRTMRVGAESELAGLRQLNDRDGPLLKISDDPRVSRLGRILRATSIDELPQLWNVLNGTMSLVGPRPALPDEVAKFDDEHRAREEVRPGITGMWQVEGRDNPSFSAYRRFDLFYIQNWSVGLDLMILERTAEALVARIVHTVLRRADDIQLSRDHHPTGRSKTPAPLVAARPTPVRRAPAARRESFETV